MSRKKSPTRIGKFIGAGLGFLLMMSCNRPIPNFLYSGKQTAPAIIDFENKSEKAERYEWDFGDGNGSEEIAPKHRYTSSGNYLVRLNAIQGKKTRKLEKRVVINPPEQCLVEIETDYGNMLVLLYDETPQHRDNFSKLADEGFFDSLLFHRVIEGFMVQGGDPSSKDAKSNAPLGSGGPGYTIPAEFVDTLVHVKGALAAARLGDQANPKKRSSGSQFYLVQGRPVDNNTLSQMEARKGIRYPQKLREEYIEKGGTPFLDKEYTVFGEVIEGMDVIDKISQVQTGPRDRPVEDVRMKIRLIK